MRTQFNLILLTAAVLLAVATGCGKVVDSPPTAKASASIDGAQFKLSDEPDGAVGVIAAREGAENGAPLVLVGRVGGTAKPWVEGRAAFTLLDASMSIVAEGEDSGEAEVCMGDCCATERMSCTTLVKVVDEQGKLVPVDSRELLGLKESDMVVVTGTAKKDQSGNFTMLANGVYVRN